MLRDIGIIGWKEIEATVLSALVARQPIMFVGSHGANKTDGARLLSYATLGRRARFQAYDTRLIHQDDLMGFANPASLREGGVVTYAHTEISIWGAKSVLLDEFNRTNPFIASKTMEIVRTKRVQGRVLDLELVFASANPPGGAYDTVYLDPAVASRFCIVRTPDRLSPAELDDVLALPENWIDDISDDKLEAFRAVIEKARNFVFSDEDQKKARDIVRSIMISLRKEPNPPVHVSARQGRGMVRMLLACEALRTTEPSLKFTEKDSTNLLMSMLPETSGMCKLTVDSSVVKPFVSRILSGFRLKDPLITATLLSMLDRRIPDQPVWAASVKSLVQTCTDPVEVHTFLTRLRSTQGLDADTFSALCAAGIERYLTLAADEGDARLVPVTWDRTELSTYIKSLFASQPEALDVDPDDLIESLT